MTDRQSETAGCDSVIQSYTTDLINGYAGLEVGIEGGRMKVALTGAPEFVWLATDQRLRVIVEPARAEQTPIRVTITRVLS